MDLLPDLSIEEDLANLEMTDTDKIQEDVQEAEAEDTSIFVEKPTTENTKPVVPTSKKKGKKTEIGDMEFDEDTKRLTEKPKKKKRELTQKQKETLAKNREKALATRRAKAEAKKKAAQEAVEEIEAKRRLKKATKSTPKKLDDIQNDVQEKEQPKTEIDLQFQEKIKENEEERIRKEKEEEEKYFMRFMGHMEKFQSLVHQHNQEKAEKRRKAEAAKPKPPPPKPKPVVKQVISKPKPAIAYDPGDDWFG